jgi:hypothetical protein
MITIHDELMGYKGNFKSNHKIRKRLDDITKTGKKKETDNKLILCNPEIGSSFEIITGTAGCGVGVKALRYCFKSLLDDHTDAHFTGRLMKIVTEIYHRDTEGATGKKSIFFSKERDYLTTLVFHIRERNVEMLSNQFICSHTTFRDKATLSLNELKISYAFIPNGATHYRILNHLSIISDYSYSEINKSFEPLSLLNILNVIAFSKYIPVGVPLTDDIVVSLPVNDDLPDCVSVIQCVGIEYCIKSGIDKYIIMRGGSVMVYEVF